MARIKDALYIKFCIVFMFNEDSSGILTICLKSWVETYFFFIYRPFDTLTKGRRRVLLLSKGQGQKPGSATRLPHAVQSLDNV